MTHSRAPLTYKQAIESARRRLAEGVERRGPDECWPWTGPVAYHGYGMLGFARAAVEAGLPAVPTASWVALFLEVGPPPEGLHCLHSPVCDRTCCNPAHLRWGTSAENMQDRVRDHRSGFQILSVEDVSTIREQMSKIRKPNRGAAYAHLAEKYGISQSTIRKIVNGTGWAWLDGPTTRGSTKRTRGAP